MVGTVSSQNVLVIIISELFVSFFGSIFFPLFLFQFFFFSTSLFPFP